MQTNVRTDMPVLAVRAGIYRERPTTGPIGKLFRCVWSHTVPSGFAGRVAIVPDGCSGLIWAGGEMLVVGPDRFAAFPRLAPGETIFGLRFRPGAALRWLDVSLSELTGQTVPLRHLRSDACEIEQQLADEASLERKLALLHAWALRQATSAAGPVDEMEALFDALKTVTVNHIADRYTFGQRTLRRHSHDHFGYGPKTLERILRFQRFLGLVRASATQSLAHLSLEAGYADQAHMTRDVREFSTLTPQDIRWQLAG
ncbi:helix-turn-helix domain-containing protein [Rhizobium puerariae]|uniref:Helix-turn-helix domain-containing protein n=1 Tax=Rhizobium puerariae TaxID=1585791 RepID=A0ABV6AD95_9HYPH